MGSIVEHLWRNTGIAGGRCLRNQGMFRSMSNKERKKMAIGKSKYDYSWIFKTCLFSEVILAIHIRVQVAWRVQQAGTRVGGFGGEVWQPFARAAPATLLGCVSSILQTKLDADVPDVVVVASTLIPRKPPLTMSGTDTPVVVRGMTALRVCRDWSTPQHAPGQSAARL